jgi:hypothetical protein
MMPSNYSHELTDYFGPRGVYCFRVPVLGFVQGGLDPWKRCVSILSPANAM